MRYLLDTNACIAIINGTPAKVVDRFQSTLRFGTEIYVSSISSFELWNGVEKSSRREFNLKRVETFFAGVVGLLAFEAEDAVCGGQIGAELERQGTPIGPYDLLIAGQALRHGLVLITANLGEFSRVRGLMVENWQR